MDFFQHQEQARTATRQLILLFVLAVVAIAAAVNLVTALGFGFIGLPRPQHLFLTNTLLIVLFIGGGSLLEIGRLRAGGAVVAQMVGGRAVTAATRDPLERRLLNVVEEMALAAGVPVPQVYVLDRENGINAFAAGWSVNDAVIAVTRGALARLQRQELQGVVGHEFSHILNGDMRLNLRLMGVLYGLLMLSLFGRFLMESSAHSRTLNERKAPSFFVLLGGSVWLLGWIGVFFGRLIKAAVSRRREFLADASAVQFTRDVDGLGAALRKIGGLAHGGEPGSHIGHRQAEALSHLFLGPVSQALAGGLLATHPPLEERIRRLYGRPMPWLDAPELALEPPPPPPALAPLDYPAAPSLPEAISPVADLAHCTAAASVAAPAVAAAVGSVALPGHPDFSLTPEQQALLTRLRDQAQDSASARPMLLALLIDRDHEVSREQTRRIAEALGGAAAAAVNDLHALIVRLPPGTRLLLADLATPALKEWPLAERERLLQLTRDLIAADSQVSLPEFLLYTVMERRLGHAAHRPVPAKYRSAAELPAATALLLSLVAALRLPDDAGRAFAAGLSQLDGVAAQLTPAPQIRLDALRAALAQLNQLAPLAKPALIKAVTAVAFVDEHSTWRAASALRTIAIALDSPLPPRLLELDPA